MALLFDNENNFKKRVLVEVAKLAWQGRLATEKEGIPFPFRPCWKPLS